MNTLQSAARVIETRYVWGPDIVSCMEKAQHMTKYGWTIEGNPCPMIFRGQYGTGVSISKSTDGFGNEVHE